MNATRMSPSRKASTRTHLLRRARATLLGGALISTILLLLATTSCCRPSGCGAPNADAESHLTATGERPRVTIPADTLHGYVIPDPHRWLEDFESPKAQSWIDEQQAATREFLDAFPHRDDVRARLSELFDIGHLGTMALRGDRLFLVKRSRDQQQPVLYVQSGLRGELVQLIDPDVLGNESPVTLDWWYPSPDGELLVYGTSTGGSEMSTLRVLDVETVTALADTIPRTRLASIAWRPDASGFYYTRFPARDEVPEGEQYFHRKVYYHELGVDYRDDPLVFGGDMDMRVWTGASVSTDGRFLLGYASYGSARNDLFVRDLESGKDWTPVVEGEDARTYGLAIGSDLYMFTTLGAPNGRIVRVDLENPDVATWREIVPETENSIGSFLYANGRLLVSYLENAHERVDVFTDDGQHLETMPLPDYASLADWTCDWRRDDVLLNLSSYLMPPTIVHHDLGTGLSSTHMRVEAQIDSDAYVTRQVWYPSRDGTMISMFLVHGKDIALDGTNPTILNGYGGFNISMTPEFARNRCLWFEHGGVYAVPNLRGGGEYGEDWHRAGVLESKQNSFDDFTAAAEWLMDEGYTSPEKLAVWGGSNGGLLVTAFVTQRPDLAAAAIAVVPLTDMTRFHLLYGGSIWTPEYGSPDDPEQFVYLYAYSPYHMVVEGTEYPAVYLTTAETDTRVHPSHALKMAARLQEATASGKPVLLRYERQAGHAMGARMSTLLDEYVDYYSFLFQELGIEW